LKKLVLASFLLASLATPALAQRITEFPVSVTSTFPFGITAERRHGYLAYTSFLGNTLGFMKPDGTLLPDYTLPNANSQPTYICQGPDGGLWFSLQHTNRIGRYGPYNDFPDGQGGFTSYREYTIPTADATPSYITAAPDGNVYATEATGGSLIRIPYDGDLAEVLAKHAGGTSGIDGSSPSTLLYTQPSASSVVEVNLFVPGTFSINYYVQDGTNPTGIVFGPDYHIWVLESGTNMVRRITPFPFDEVGFPIPTADSGPKHIINGPDGNLWFLETNFKNKLARITPSGVITEYQLPGIPADLAAGPDGNIWITEPAANKLIRFKPFLPGDANADGTVDISDVFYLINFLFAGGPPPKF
jgi:virginiamycin B lyase